MKTVGSEQLPSAVFVVEDDAAVRKALGALFKSASLPVRAFSNGTAFLESYRDDIPCCIVMDVRLPDISGPQVLQRLRTTREYCPKIVFITGYGDVATAVAAMKQGALDFLQKPFPPQVLLDVVQAAIESDRTDIAQRRDVRALTKAIESLTDREREILQELFQGKLNKQIARETKLSEKTIAAHRANILNKLGKETLVELIHALTVCGWGR